MSDFQPTDEAPAWRQEVASRVDDYRARRGRPRPQRDSSLQLDFEPPAIWEEPVVETAGAETRPAESLAEAAAPAGDAAAAAHSLEAGYPPPAPRHEPPRPRRTRARNLIEFPGAGRLFDELAEPIVDTPPRILDVPEAEVPPPPPQLAGITLDEQPPAAEHDPLAEVPLQAAPLGLRAAATLLDALCVAAAAAVFVAVAAQMNVTLAPARPAAMFAVLIAGLLWAGYQYLFLVYGGNTPGKRALGLILATFDGEPVARGLRRRRALASLLSYAPLGLGLLWSLVDEDNLCWHDRITRTCVTTPEAIEP